MQLGLDEHTCKVCVQALALHQPAPTCSRRDTITQTPRIRATETPFNHLHSFILLFIKAHRVLFHQVWVGEKEMGLTPKKIIII